MAILGIDEAGRGPWAGPLVVGAVILPENPPAWASQLQDSKKLTPKKRAALNTLIIAESATGLGWVDASTLDTLGLSQALKLATKRAIKALNPTAHFSQIIIDGTQNFLAGTALEHRTSTLIKADSCVQEVSAASIIAKVARDRYLCNLAEQYPGYGFEKHKGYGTALHQQKITELGVTPEHRLSFAPIQRLLANEAASSTPDPNPNSPTNPSPSIVAQNTTALGQRGELAVADFLRTQGHQILAHNFKTKLCEIDLISTDGTHLFFTEVKYRRNSLHGGGLAAITPAKLRQMEFAARVFLQLHPNFSTLEPLLAAAEVEGLNFTVQNWFPLTD